MSSVNGIKKWSKIQMDEDIVSRLLKRAEIRRQIPGRKSVQEGKPDRIADLLEEAANEIVLLRGCTSKYVIVNRDYNR
jgi:hypothetical protein